MYKYYFRPEYGSSELLIEFFHDVENDSFLSSLLNAISELKPKIGDITDLWMNDEILLNVTSEIGEFTISKDIWGFAFIIAKNNQECLSRINSILKTKKNYEKVEVDFENYKLK
jgi:hypothetical protein